MTTPEEIRAKAEELRNRSESMGRTPARHVKEIGGYQEIIYLVADLLAGLSVGGLVGYYIDEWLNTGPWGLMICLILGGAAGFLAVMRMSARPLENKEEKTSKEKLDKPS